MKEDSNKDASLPLSSKHEEGFNNKALIPLVWQSCLLFLLWGGFCWQGLVTVVDIWWGNEIFNHGFFIVPGAFYLIYLQRKRLLTTPIKPSLLSLTLILPSLFLYVVGVAGDIRLFMHLATFTLLPSLIWFLLGTQATRVILFPLCFMLFSVPVGEQLIPYLQEIAADGSVALLKLTGIPLYRSGLYIEIPQGRFLVAEACSGVSFFIASFVIGSLYAYLNLNSAKRRTTFVLISLIFPILANIVRVYGIILIAYWTDMEYAAGADHLIYGWFFFAFVIVCLLGLGELMRKKQSSTTSTPHTLIERAIEWKKVSGVALLLVASITWVFWVNKNTASIGGVDQPIFNQLPKNWYCDKYDPWKPLLQQPTRLTSQGIRVSGTCSTVVHAWFNDVDGELVSSLHRLFSPNDWSRVEAISVAIPEGEVEMVSGVKIANPTGSTRYVSSWYLINGKVFNNEVKAKLYQVYLSLQGKPTSGGLVIVSSPSMASLSSTVNVLMKSFSAPGALIRD